MATRKSFYGKECKGGLSASQAASGYRLFYVSLQGPKNGAYRECYRAIVKGLSRSRWPRYVVVGVPKGGTNPHALFWTAKKSLAERVVSQKQKSHKRLRIRDVKEDKGARAAALKRAKK